MTENMHVDHAAASGAAFSSDGGRDLPTSQIAIDPEAREMPENPRKLTNMGLRAKVDAPALRSPAHGAMSTLRGAPLHVSRYGTCVGVGGIGEEGDMTDALGSHAFHQEQNANFACFDAEHDLPISAVELRLPQPSPLAPPFDRFDLGYRAVCPTRGTMLVHADSLDWLARAPDNSVHAIVTDPPYGVVEYEDKDLEKLKAGKGGVWRIPPTLDGVQRAPLPRFTVLTLEDRKKLNDFFEAIASHALRVLVPGGHVIMAANPLMSTAAFWAFEMVGFEKRGEIIRIVKTLRGGDRPKGAEVEFHDVSVMPKSCWEPWGLFRKPISEKTVAANLRKWGTGGLRRLSQDEPFRDVIECPPARGEERRVANHPSLKPQKLMRALVKAALPVGTGIILDPFNGSGSTIAAAASMGYSAIGIERDHEYFEMASSAISKLAVVKA